MLTDHILSGFVKDISRQRLDLGFFAVAGIIVSAAIMLINIIVVMLFVNAFINLMQREFGSVDFNSSSYSDDNYDSPFDNQDRQELEDLLNQLESEQQS